jgi:hypothetical protein
MPIMNSYAVFVKRPPKEGERVRYSILQVSYSETPEDIELRIAAQVSEGRLIPVPAGGTHYMIFTTDKPQSAANAARDAGLCYMSLEAVMRMKADRANGISSPEESAHGQETDDDNPFADLFDFLKTGPSRK